MNILVVEDRGTVSFYLIEALQGEGHTVLGAFDINDAKAHWEYRATVPIDCMIVDLDMAPNGLTAEEQEASQNGLLTAWLWLRNYVFPQVPEAYRQRVIIYSEYLANFKQHVPADEYREISLIPKRTPSGSAKEVLDRVGEVSRLPRVEIS